MKIYVPIFVGCYEEFHVDVAFSTMDLANAWIVKKCDDRSYREYDFRIDELDFE